MIKSRTHRVLINKKQLSLRFYYSSPLKSNLKFSRQRQTENYFEDKKQFITPKKKKKRQTQKDYSPLNKSKSPYFYETVPHDNNIKLLIQFQKFQTQKIPNQFKSFLTLNSGAKFKHSQNYRTSNKQPLQVKTINLAKTQSQKKVKIYQRTDKDYIFKQNNSQQVKRQSNVAATPRLQIYLTKKDCKLGKKQINKKTHRDFPYDTSQKRKGLSLVSSEKSLTKLERLKKYDRRMIKPRVWFRVQQIK